MTSWFHVALAVIDVERSVTLLGKPKVQQKQFQVSGISQQPNEFRSWKLNRSWNIYKSPLLYNNRVLGLIAGDLCSFTGSNNGNSTKITRFCDRASRISQQPNGFRSWKLYWSWNTYKSPLLHNSRVLGSIAGDFASFPRTAVGKSNTRLCDRRVRILNNQLDLGPGN